MNSLTPAALWPDLVTGLTRLFLLAVFTTGLIWGIRLIGRGASTRRRWRRMQREAVPAVATVLSLREQAHFVDAEGREWRTVTPTLQFPTASGELVTVEGPVAAAADLSVGATVAIRYHPQDPSQVDILRPDAPLDTGSRLLVSGIVAVVFASILLIGVPLVIMASARP